MVATDVKRRKNDQCPRKTFEDANFWFNEEESCIWLDSLALLVGDLLI